MIQTFLGLVLLLLPFIAVLGFENKLKGFLSVFSIGAVFHLCVALITQSAHLFSYGVIIFFHLVFNIFWIGFLYQKRKSIVFGQKIVFDWFVAGIFLIILLFLTSVHYRYSGVVDTTFGSKMVSNSSYTYPIYSDEWSAVSFINHSISNKSLPLVNPLNPTSPFVNFLAGFHSLMSEIFLLLNLVPLTHYVWFAILNGILTSLFVFLILRLSKVSVYSSAISAISIPFITNAGNLPGIWSLLPYNLSVTFLLLSVVGFLIKSRLVVFSGLLLALIVYPPIVVFVLPIILAIFLSENEKLNLKLSDIKHWGILVFLIALGTIFFVAAQSGFGPVEIIKRATGFIVRDRLNSGITIFEIWNVLPIFVLPFAVFGLIEIFRKKINYILFPTAAGLFFWVLYCFTPLDFIIGPPRIVSITSIFLIISSGFGLDWFYKYLSKQKYFIFDHVNIRSLKIATLILFVAFSVSYSRIGLWHKFELVIKDESGVRKYTPASPITRYLIEDDLNLFAEIKDKKFISPPWKGLVIGVATNNYPLDSKSSTIANKTLIYKNFMSASCEQKENYAKKFEIDFAYTKQFSCASFVEIGKSGEGLILYKVVLK